jgi:hypothetical protein
MNALEIKTKALTLVTGERNRWEAAQCFVTPRVSFAMRSLIETCRKNYMGVFDTPNDENTNRRKIWIPLTESTVESVVKNIDLDAKDIVFYAKHPAALDLTHIIRSKVRNELSAINFGEKLDLFERRLAIDGTAVWKTGEGMDSRLKRETIKLYDVDLLNFYIDPSAPSIAEAGRVTERSIMTPAEIRRMDWMDTDNFTGAAHRYDRNMSADNEETWVDVYESWGKYPESLITGDDKDINEVDLHIVVSGIDGNGGRVHKIERFDGKKPYEEAWYQRVPNRWYGRGVAEKLIMLQLWMNTIVNIRINRSYVQQLGLFKIRKGSGVTPQMLSRLAANGAVTVNSMDDLEQLIVQEASQASYNDENIIQTWSERVTAAFESVTGEALPASTTATIGAIQNKSAMSQFVLIREGLGNFLERWVKNQVLPILADHCTPGEIIRITGNPEDVMAYKQAVAKRLAVGMDGEYTDNVANMTEQIPEYIKIENASDIAWDDYDVGVNVTNSSIDESVLMQNIIQAMQIAPEQREPLTRSLFDIMGIPYKPAPAQVTGQDMQNAQGVAQPMTSSTDQLTRANSPFYGNG